MFSEFAVVFVIAYLATFIISIVATLSLYAFNTWRVRRAMAKILASGVLQPMPRTGH